MSDTTLAIPQQPTRQAVEAQDRSAPRRVTGKLKVAVDAMVWEGSRRNEAAEKAGLSVHGLREAFRKPHVKAYYLAQLEVLRTSERARNIHRLTEIRDAANNMPAVQAIRDLERLPDDNASSAKGLAPGFVVQIVNVQQVASMPHTPMVEAKPLKSQDDV